MSLFLWWNGAENMVPEYRADSEALFRVFIMMEVMIAPEGLQERRGREGVNGIVHAAIHEIAEQKARKKGQHIPAHDQVLQAEEKRSHNNAGHRRHKQPLPVSRIFVMDTMQLIDHRAQPRALGYKMENKAVQHIFHQAPDKHAEHKEQDHAACAEVFVYMTVIKKKGDNGEIKAVNNNRVRFRHHLQVLALKQPALAFIFDLVDMHPMPVLVYEYNTSAIKIVGLPIAGINYSVF